MLTPQFRCRQEGKFVIVEIVLQTLTKLSEAQFDITENQFTFYCSPYYLRLTFSHWLAEGQGEHATYDWDNSILTVFLPKLKPAEDFFGLEFSNLLLATRKQRKQWVVEQNASENEKKEPEQQEAQGPPSRKRKRKLSAERDKHDEKVKEGGSEESMGEEEEDGSSSSETAESEPDTEYIQTLQSISGNQIDVESGSNLPTTSACSYYGFNDKFKGYFSSLDRSLTDDIVDLPDPDHTSEEQRIVLKKQEELLKFDGGFGILEALVDEDGSIHAILHEDSQYQPWYVKTFEELLRTEEVAFITAAEGFSKASQPLSEGDRVKDGYHLPAKEILEEESSPGMVLPTNSSQHVLAAWEGNVDGLISNGNNTLPIKPTMKGSDAHLEHEGKESEEEEAEKKVLDGNHHPSDALPQDIEVVDLRTNCTSAIHPEGKGGEGTGIRKLACPKNKPIIQFTMEESNLLASLQARSPAAGKPTQQGDATTPSAFPLIIQEQRVYFMLVDILAAAVYDILTSQGEGTVESAWTISKLSSTLSWLQPFDSLHEVCVSFCRRVCIFPLYRSFDLATRCLRDVGIILLSGTSTILRVLLYAKYILDHSEGKYALCTLYVNPLMEYLISSSTAVVNEKAEQLALALHSVMLGRGGEEGGVQEESQKKDDQHLSLASLSIVTAPSSPLASADQPISLQSLGLPLTAFEEEETEEES